MEEVRALCEYLDRSSGYGFAQQAIGFVEEVSSSGCYLGIAASSLICYTRFHPLQPYKIQVCTAFSSAAM